MKERVFICSVITALFICFMSCENPIIKSWWEEQGNVNDKIANTDKIDNTGNGVDNTGNGVDNSNIVKVDPVVYWPNDLKVLRGRTLADINLPPSNIGPDATRGTFAWTKMSFVSEYDRKQSFEMIFTPYDTSNYNTVTENVEITVITIDLVRVPDGTFLMGSPDDEPGQFLNEEPQHQVTMSGFFIGKYPVTLELFEAVMNYSRRDIYQDKLVGIETPGMLPMQYVGWCEALIFCNKLSMMLGLSPAYRIPAFNNSTDPADWERLPLALCDEISPAWNTAEIVPGSNGYRLPTEAQWEYACRAGTTTSYNTGDTFSDDIAWYEGNSGNWAHMVGLKKPNNWGLYDMHGNVWEWCWDRIEKYTSTPQTDPVGLTSGRSRTLRGGSYTEKALRLRSASKTTLNIDGYGIMIVGFRIVRP
jgi:formylglycine-generating enzyme required for sulfatase activity